MSIHPIDWSLSVSTSATIPSNMSITGYYPSYASYINTTGSSVSSSDVLSNKTYYNGPYIHQVGLPQYAEDYRCRCEKTSKENGEMTKMNDKFKKVVEKYNLRVLEYELTTLLEEGGKVKVEFPASSWERMLKDLENCNTMPKIKDIKVYGNKVTKVEFDDGTFTKCIAEYDFDLYTGIAFCLFKRILGENGHRRFNDLMREAYKIMDKNDKAREKEVEEKRKKKEKRLKQEQKRLDGKKKARQEQIDIQKEAILAALREKEGD